MSRITDDLTTHYDANGIERWDDGTKVSTGNAFRQTYTGVSWTRQLSLDHAGSMRSAKRIAAQNAKGENPGKMYGLSHKSDERYALLASQRRAQQERMEDECEPRRA